MSLYRPNPAKPPAGVELCAVSELTDPGTKGFIFREGTARFWGLLVRKGDEVMGYVDSCPHAGWPLSPLPDRYLTRDADRLFCGGHGALFRVEDGLCTAGPCAGDSLLKWPVLVDDEGIIRTA